MLPWPEADQAKLVDQKDTTKYGLGWVDSVSACNIGGELDYSVVPFYGISARQVVTYLDSSLSSKENMLNNEVALANAIDGSFRIFNNIEKLVFDTLDQQCKGDLSCSAYFSLCFTESSDIFLCDEEDKASDEIFVPQPEDLVNEYDLVGLAFKLKPRRNNMCYLATSTLERIDGERSLYLDEKNSKMIKVKDPGEPPYF